MKITRSKMFRFAIALALSLSAPAAGFADTLPIIDAHNQSDEYISYDEILRLMDAAGVARVILAQRGRVQPQDLLDFAAAHPDRITPAVRTKGQKARQVREQANTGRYGAMAEILLWHREKKRQTVTTKSGETRAPPLVVMAPDHSKVGKLLAVARAQAWPLILHIEFASAGDDAAPFMAKLEDLLRGQPDHPFVLIHMGMLPFEEVRRLIEAHANIHFITAHSDPVAVGRFDAPFTPMFDGASLAPRWKQLMIRHPDRFLLGFDSVWAHVWRKFYFEQVGVWRQALRELPDAVAHAVAHGNAERLWRLPPAK
jgi:predicted TIM-barrel fold metal-dependent hydrolase